MVIEHVYTAHAHMQAYSERNNFVAMGMCSIVTTLITEENKC